MLDYYSKHDSFYSLFLEGDNPRHLKGWETLDKRVISYPNNVRFHLSVDRDLSVQLSNFGLQQYPVYVHIVQ